MPADLFRLVDLRPRLSRSAPSSKRLFSLFLASAVLFLIAMLLFLFGVPFPIDEEVKPNVVILARARDPEHKAFIDALHNRLMQSRLAGSVRFAESVGGEHSIYRPALASVVPISTTGGADAIAEDLAALARKDRSPLVAVTINSDDSPNALWWGKDGKDRLGRLLSAGVLCLDLADPPEAQPDMQIGDITRGLEPATHIHLITVNAKAAPDESRTLRLKLRGSHPELAAMLTGSHVKNQALRVTLEKDGASIEIPFRITSSDHPDLCDLSIPGLDPADIEELVFVKEAERPPASKTPPRFSSHLGQRSRALLVPVAAFLENILASDPAWRRQLRGYLDGDSILRFVSDGSRGRVVFGRTVTAPPYDCDVLRPMLPDEAGDAAEALFGHLSQAFVDTDSVWRQADRYPLVILDLSWPVGLPAEGRDQFVNALKSSRFKEFLGKLNSLLRTRPVHVLVLGYTSLLLDRNLPEHPLDSIVREVDEEFSGKTRLSKGTAGTNLYLIFDRTESAGNAADIETARLRTLPPLSLDAYRRLTDLLQSEQGTESAAAAASRPENVALVRRYLQRLLGAELLGDRPLDENAIARFNREVDSKASVLAAIASGVAYWGQHPLLNLEVQGDKRFPAWFWTGGPPEAPLDSRNQLVKLADGSTLEAVELADMLEYLRWSAKQAVGENDATRGDSMVALLLYDADDPGEPNWRSVRSGGQANRLPYTATPYNPKGPLDGFMLGLRQMDHAQGPFETGTLKEALENRNTKSSKNSTAFGPAFLYGGRSRLADFASASLADRLRTRRAFTAYPQLAGLTSRLGLANRDKALSDEFCALTSATLRLTTRPSVTVIGGTPLVSLAGVKTEENESWPLFLVGRAGNGGVLTLCTVDFALEQEVFRHTFAAAATRFDDWIFSTNQVDSDSGQHLLHVESVGAMEDGAVFRFELFTVDDRRIPVMPKARQASFTESETAVSAKVFSRSGTPVLSLPLTLRHGMLTVPMRVGDKLVAPGGEAFVRLKIKIPEFDEVFDVFMPVAFRSPDTQFSLQTSPCLSSTLIVYAEMIHDALASASDLDVRGPSQMLKRTNPRDNIFPSTHHGPRAPAANGIGVGIQKGMSGDRRVISCRLELPLREESLSTEHGEVTRADVAARWINERIHEVFVASTSRNWLIVASLFGGLATIIRSRIRGWWPSRDGN